MADNSSKDFTVPQATDLARYYLGSGWFALSKSSGESTFNYMLTSDGAGAFIGKSWRSVFRDAGVKLPYKPRFSSVGKRILRAGDQVAVAVSGNLAERIANALNEYEPGARGK